MKKVKKLKKTIGLENYRKLAKLLKDCNTEFDKMKGGDLEDPVVSVYKGEAKVKEERLRKDLNEMAQKEIEKKILDEEGASQREYIERKSNLSKFVISRLLEYPVVGMNDDGDLVLKKLK